MRNQQLITEIYNKKMHSAYKIMTKAYWCLTYDTTTQQIKSIRKVEHFTDYRFSKSQRNQEI